MAEGLDVGCGRAKAEGYLGMDGIPFPGVDVVWNLEDVPWPFEADRFDRIRVIHVVEHVENQTGFFKELHRVARDGAIVHLETPHFSSRDSWADPTHVRHFSAFFADPMTGDGYLTAVTGRFEVVSRRVNFGSFFRSWRARLVVALSGYEAWERNAFRMPGLNVHLDLKVIKP